MNYSHTEDMTINNITLSNSIHGPVSHLIFFEAGDLGDPSVEKVLPSADRTYMPTE